MALGFNNVGQRIHRSVAHVLKGIGALIFILVAAIGGFYIYTLLPIHQIGVNCYSLGVVFEGPKSEEFIALFKKKLEERGEPYFLKDGHIHTTGDGIYYEQMSKIIMYEVRPEWFTDHPRFKNKTPEKIVNAWKSSEDRYSPVSKEWCHVVEAAVARDGIDAKARREHPNIWPPDKWYVPPE